MLPEDGHQFLVYQPQNAGIDDSLQEAGLDNSRRLLDDTASITPQAVSEHEALRTLRGPQDNQLTIDEGHPGFLSNV